MGRSPAAQPRRTNHDQGQADEQEQDAADQQAEEDGPEQIGAGTGLQVNSHGAAGIGIHDDHGPGPGPQIPFELLGSRPRGGGCPDLLIGRPGRGPGPRNLPVLGAERIEPDVDDLGMFDVGQVRLHLGPGRDADEDCLRRIGGRAPQHYAAGQACRALVGCSRAGHDIEARGAQGIGVRGKAFQRRGEVPAVALLVVGPPGGSRAGQQPQAQKRAERAQHQHDNPAWSHGRRPFTRPRLLRRGRSRPAEPPFPADPRG